MPYVQTRRGASPISASHLAAYVWTVRAKARGRGMGQDSLDAGGFDPGALDAGGFPIDTTPVVPIDTTPVPGDTGIVSNPSTPFDWSKLISSLTAGAGAGASLYRSLTPPSLVPGTNAIFNPATGQFYNPLTGQVVNPTGTTPTTNIPLAGLTGSSTLWIVGGLGLVVLVVALSSKKSS